MTVKEKVERMREFTETTESSEITNDALTAILGDSHRGRVRGYGFGVTVTKLKFQNGASRKYEKTIDEMQQKLQRQEQRQEEMLKQMQVFQSMFAHIANNQSFPNAPPQVSPTTNMARKRKFGADHTSAVDWWALYILLLGKM
ncbi:uncharacterized protein LOC132283872 isoform X2 [Cornus florida]|uniref:uncharacterized protein LOC132283872 isoform X2 n=1 Tax=Cornus florida TaxID=4283 RepID=UPI00289AF4A3|nr:uncharacterized protein LOC132283872 isoform X2 [Cornus florida]